VKWGNGYTSVLENDPPKSSKKPHKGSMQVKRIGTYLKYVESACPDKA